MKTMTLSPRCAPFRNEQGMALLGALMLALILLLLGATLLNITGQEAISAAAGRDAAVAHHLADAAAELIIGWFHTPHAAPPSAAAMLMKRKQAAGGTPSFFDHAGRSQFTGTPDHPDMVLRGTDHGLFRTMEALGTMEELKIYAPSRPGLLCTIEATVASRVNAAIRQSVMVQLAALELPPIRAAVQVGSDLGQLSGGSASPVAAHWGDITVRGDLALRRAADFPVKTALAAVTALSYDEMPIREDRWTEGWIGGLVHVLQPVAQQPGGNLPSNLHAGQVPVPGVRFDQWSYEQLKNIAKRHGSYFAVDREGLLYQEGIVRSGRGRSPDDVLASQAVGDHRGLIFIDTMDQTAPRHDNLATITIRARYLEALVVVQGHVVLAPAAPGESLSVLSPPTRSADQGTTRTPVQLTGVQLNGLLHAAGTVTVSGRVRVFGAVTAQRTVVAAEAGNGLEVWYNHDYAAALYQGLPLVYRASGTWMARY